MTDTEQQQAFADSEAEVEKIVDIINNSGTGYTAKTAKDYWKKKFSTLKDLEYGDLIIYDKEGTPIEVDAKRNWKISENSIHNFKGDYILFYENKNYEMEFIPFGVLKSYVATYKPTELRSGKPGWEIPRARIRARKTLEEI